MATVEELLAQGYKIATPAPIAVDPSPLPEGTTQINIGNSANMPTPADPVSELLAQGYKVRSNNTPSLFNDPIGALTSSDWWHTRPSGEKISTGQAVAGPMLSALDVLTLGGADEIGSLAGVPVEQVRGIQDNFRNASPVGDVLLQTATAFKNPLVMASKVGQMSGALKKGFQLAKEGALFGSLYGFGEGEDGLVNRLKSGTSAGLISGALAPAVGLPLMYGSEAILNKASQYAPQAKEIGKRLFSKTDRNLASQKGAVTLGGGEKLPSYSPTEMMLAKQLKNVPYEKITAAADEMATVGDSPLFLPEALKSAKVDRNARFVANNEASMDFAKDAIEARTAGASTRANNALRKVSPVESTFEGGKQMTSAAEKILGKAKANRFLVSDPLYKQAYKDRPIIKDPDFADFLASDKDLQSAINKVKRNFRFSKLPDNSTKVLVNARSSIGAEIKLAANGAEKGRLQDTYDELNRFLHKSGEGDSLIVADATFAHSSGGIDELSESFLANLSRVSDNKIQNIGQVFNLPKEQIVKLRSTFEDAGMLDEWNAGIKAHLSDSISSVKDGRNFTKELIGDDAMRGKMQAALGDKYRSVSKSLELENRMFEGRNKYYPGSSTAGNLAEEASFRRGVGTIRRLVGGDFAGAFESLMSGDMPEEVAQGLAKIYFDPKTGKETIRNIMPLMKAYKDNKVLANALTQASAKGGTSSAVSQKDRREFSPIQQQRAPMQQEPTRPQSQLEQRKQSQQKIEVQSDPSLNNATNSTLKQPISYTPKMIKELVKDEPKIVKAIVKVESAFNHKAKSPKGALGLAQLMPENIKTFGIKDPFDPNESIRGLKLLLSEELDRYKDNPILAIAAYNLGSPKLDKAIARAGSKNWSVVRRYVPTETANYVSKVLAATRSV